MRKNSSILNQWLQESDKIALRKQAEFHAQFRQATIGMLSLGHLPGQKTGKKKKAGNKKKPKGRGEQQ